MSEKLNIYQKIQAVSNEVKVIEKNMTVGSGNYSYKAVSDLDVVSQINAAETKFGLVSVPIMQELVHSEIIKTVGNAGKEGLMYLDKVKITLRIVDLEDITSFIEVEAFGTGLDNGDKGFGKAATYARKYALLNAYKIPTGTDPDADKSKEQQAKSEPNQTMVIVQDYCMKNNDYLQQVLSHFNVGSFSDFTEKNIDAMYKNLKAKNLV